MTFKQDLDNQGRFVGHVSPYSGLSKHAEEID